MTKNRKGGEMKVGTDDCGQEKKEQPKESQIIEPDEGARAKEERDIRTTRSTKQIHQ